MEKFNPTAYLLKIQKIKYTEAIIPILIIFSGFAINFIKPYSFVKYLSLLGLLGFLFISLKYRIRKNIPPEENGVILSPVYGVICNLNNAAGTFIIKKGFFTSADYRCPTSDKEMVFEVTKGKCELFESDCQLPGKLIGVLPLSAEILCKSPEDYQLEIEEGQKVTAGETILAIRK